MSDERITRDKMLTPGERVGLWKVARGLARTKDDHVLLAALYHDHADCANGRDLIPHERVDALIEAVAEIDAESNGERWDTPEGRLLTAYDALAPFVEAAP